MASMATQMAHADSTPLTEGDSTEVLNLIEDMDDFEGSDKKDPEIEEIFNSLKVYGDLKKYSLSEVLQKALSEENRYFRWKESGQPLKKIGLFYRVEGERFPIFKSYELSDPGYMRFDNLKERENAYLEISSWEEENDEDSYFTLYRVAFSTVLRKGKFKAVEMLSEGKSITFRGTVRSGEVSVRVSHSGKFSFIKPIINVCQTGIRKFHKVFSMPGAETSMTVALLNEYRLKACMFMPAMQTP
jgi:hypothetical protein